MLTVDDANSISKKYKEGFWYKLDCSNLDISYVPQGGNRKFKYDGFSIMFIDRSMTTGGTDIRLTVYPNTYYTRLIYATYQDGSIAPVTFDDYLANNYIVIKGIDLESFNENPFIFNIYVTSSPTNLPNNTKLYNCLFLPLSPLQIPVIDGEFDNKFYIKVLGNAITAYTIDGNVVELSEDENGKYFNLPSANDCIIGTKYKNVSFPLYHITFREFKTLPIPYIPTLYKGTPQNVQVLNSEDDDPISDYQTYYQGRQLKDNTIHLPYDADDYINIIVDLKDYRYPFCTVKLKAPTTIYTANSQSDVETAIENGIQTLQVGDTETEVTLNAIELSNVTLINSNIKVSESILTDCQIIDSTYTDNGGNNITSTLFKDTDYNTTAQSNYNEVTFNECDIHDSEINLTGTITDSTITDTLIISDGVINIRDNTFTGVGSKDYFPSHLYLTGDYTVTGNTFNLEGEWTELEYNMCLIKATNDFNPSQFIRDNIFNLNITYDDEPTNTFYYNIVDDDKIRAVRL